MNWWGGTDPDGDTALMADLTGCEIMAVVQVHGPSEETTEDHEPECPFHDQDGVVYTLTLGTGCCGDSLNVHLTEEDAAGLCAMLTHVFHERNPSLLNDKIIETMENMARIYPES